jgi:CheY-like chemotaxis protein
MQGDELLPLLKANPRYQDIKIVVFTALNLKPEHEKKIIAQANGYVLKMDLTPKELVKKVDKLIAD